MSRVLFGQSYHLRFDPKLWRAMQPYPPLGSLIAAACVREMGLEVAFLDSMLAPTLDSWREALEEQAPSFSVIYEDNFNYLTKMCLLRMREAAREMVELAKRQGSTVICCGSDASDHPELYLDVGADFVILGEGEETLAELLSHLLEGRPASPARISGLAYRSSDSGDIRTAPRPVMRDLDALPWAARDLVDMEKYRELWRGRHGYFSLNMATTRGCPYHCNWCAKPIWGQTYHVRDPEDVAREMAHLEKRYQAEHIWFADDIMGLKPGWMKRFAEVLRAGSSGLPFKCLSRADLILRPGEVQALRAAGAESVWIGAESGCQQILDAMDKGITVEQIHAACRLLKDAGIRVGFFLQFGYPGEGRAEIEQTLQMVRDCQPDEIGMSVSYPLPGTRFHELVRNDLQEKRNWIDSEDLDMLYQGPFEGDFYRCLYEVLHGEFALERHARQLRQVRPSQWRPPYLRDLAAWSYRRVKLARDRRRLDRLARPGLKTGGESAGLDSGMSFSEASQPTVQEHLGREP